MKERFILDRILVSLYREVMRQSIDFRLALRSDGDGLARDFVYPYWADSLSCANVNFSEPMMIAFWNKLFALGIK